MNYFELFEIPVDFEIDLKNLKQVYLKLSRKFHPDFSANDSEEIQAEKLRMSALVNEAYKTLENEDLRLEYILGFNGLLNENENKKLLTQSFLFEMMELNEELQDIKSRNSISDLNVFKEKLKTYSEDLKTTTLLETEEDDQLNRLNHLLLYYLKKRYLNRLFQQAEH